MHSTSTFLWFRSLFDLEPWNVHEASLRKGIIKLKFNLVLSPSVRLLSYVHYHFIVFLEFSAHQTGFCIEVSTAADGVLEENALRKCAPPQLGRLCRNRSECLKHAHRRRHGAKVCNSLRLCNFIVLFLLLAVVEVLQFFSLALHASRNGLQEAKTHFRLRDGFFVVLLQSLAAANNNQPINLSQLISIFMRSAGHCRESFYASWQSFKDLHLCGIVLRLSYSWDFACICVARQHAMNLSAEKRVQIRIKLTQSHHRSHNAKRGWSSTKFSIHPFHRSTLLSSARFLSSSSPSSLFTLIITLA